MHLEVQKQWGSLTCTVTVGGCSKQLTWTPWTPLFETNFALVTAVCSLIHNSLSCRCRQLPSGSHYTTKHPPIRMYSHTHAHDNKLADVLHCCSILHFLHSAGTAMLLVQQLLLMRTPAHAAHMQGKTSAGVQGKTPSSSTTLLLRLSCCNHWALQQQQELL